MSYFRRVVKKRPATLTDSEWLSLRTKGGEVREHYTPRDGRDVRGPSDRVVLCWWCREHHLASEVDQCMALPRKTVATETSTSSTLSVSDAGPLKLFPELWAFLTSGVFEDGSKRLTGKMSWSCESGLLGLSLNDSETQQYAFLEGGNMAELLKEAEKRLAEGRMPWRPSKWAVQGKARK